MKKHLFAIAAAGAALTIASPASAQYYRGYGYNSTYSSVAGLQNRLANAIGTINSAPYQLQPQLYAEARSIDRQLQYGARRGLNPYQVSMISDRMQRLELALQQTVRGGGDYREQRRGRHWRD